MSPGSRDIYGCEHGPVSICLDEDLVAVVKKSYPTARIERSTFDMGTVWVDNDCIGSFWGHKRRAGHYSYRLPTNAR